MFTSSNEALVAASSEWRQDERNIAASAAVGSFLRTLESDKVSEQTFITHPFVIDDVEFTELATAGRQLVRAQRKVLRHLLETRSRAWVLERFGIPSRLAAYVRWENLSGDDWTIGRLDLIPTREGYAFCEFNLFCGVGGGEAHTAGQIYLRSIGYPDLRHGGGPLQDLASLYATSSRGRDIRRVVILESSAHAKLGFPRPVVLQQALEAANPEWNVVILDETSYPRRWLEQDEGERTLVHRMFTFEELGNATDLPEAIWKSGALVTHGFESELSMNKRLLAMLWEPVHQALLSPEERDAVACYLPQAFELGEDNLASALRDKDALVFKVVSGCAYGGGGVLIGADWERGNLERALRARGVDQWICQHAVDALKVDLRTSANAPSLAHNLVLGLYLAGDRPSGLLVRGSAQSRVVNVSGGRGWLAWAFIASKLERQALVRHALTYRRNSMATFLSDAARNPLPSSGAAHDTATPERFVSFMMDGWEARAKPPAVPYEHAANARLRRERLSKLFPGDALVIPSGHLKVRSNDEYYPFRACSDFVYLTGNQEPDCVLILLPEGAGHRPVLFVEPNPGKSDSSFFADRVKGELWEGGRLGVPETAARYQVDDVRSLGELEAFVRDRVVPRKAVRMLRQHSASLEAWIGRETDAQRAHDAELEASLSEMRLIKDDAEIAELRLAIAATRRGFEDVIRRLRTAASERELEGVFFTRARVEGNATGYGSVVAAGAHACTLHWRKNDGAVRSGELLLLDAGVEARSLYTADITRTVPIGGRFTPEQREIYDLVFAAQRAAVEAVKPGNDFMEPNRVAMRVLAHGLERLGILASADEALKPENQFYRRYSLHNVSHMLGLDVHDCAKARSEVYRYGPLAPGMVLTIEPGLYFQLDDATVPLQYRGIGVRIEDNVLVTNDGVANLSDEIPAGADEIERWIAEVWQNA